MKRYLLCALAALVVSSPARAEERVRVCGQGVSPNATFFVCMNGAGTALKDVGQLTKLKALVVVAPAADLDLSHLGALPVLETLTIDPAPEGAPFDLKRLSGLDRLADLKLSPNVDLKDIGVLKGLKALSLVAQTQVSVTPLSALKTLKSLQVNGDSTALAGAEDLPRGLEQLVVVNATLPPTTCLGDLTNLRSLTLGNPVDMGCLGRLPKLEALSITADDLTALATGFRALKALNLATQATDLAPLARLTKLKTLSLAAPMVTDLAPIAKLKQLTELSLGEDTSLTNLNALGPLTALESLSLRGLPVTDISAISGFKGLATLILAGTKVSDIAPLKALRALTWVDLSGLALGSLRPLYGAKKLHYLSLDGATYPAAELAELKALLPERSPLPSKYDQFIVSTPNALAGPTAGAE